MKAKTWKVITPTGNFNFEHHRGIEKRLKAHMACVCVCSVTSVVSDSVQAHGL